MSTTRTTVTTCDVCDSVVPESSATIRVAIHGAPPVDHPDGPVPFRNYDVCPRCWVNLGAAAVMPIPGRG